MGDDGWIDTADAAGPRRPHRWLLLLPFIWQIGLAILVNDVAWRPFGLPFPMVWQMAGILLTSGIIAIVYTIDKRIEAALPQPQEDPAP